MARLPIIDKLDQDLKDAHKELQVDIPKAIKTAREHGDLSENAEFKAAKERQMFLESRVSLLQKESVISPQSTWIKFLKTDPDWEALFISVTLTPEKRSSTIWYFRKR